MKILVTGATGFLGAHLLKKLVEKGHQIRILKEESAPLDLIKDLVENNNIEIIAGDIRKLETVRKAVKGCENVFHLVGIISYWSKFDSLQYDVNVKGTKNIVKACLENNTKRLVYVSSTTAVGTENKGKLATEETLYNLFPLRISYCDTKFLAEQEVYKGIAKGLDAVILCPGSMYGEGDARKIKTDFTFSFKFPISLIYINGGIAVVDVEDVAEGMVRALERGKKGERYLLVSENLSFYDIRKIIATALGKKTPFICLPNWFLLPLSYLFLCISKITGKKPKLTPEIARMNRVHLYFSNQKAKRELGMRFKPFKESIQKAVEWYKNHGYL